MTKKTQSDEDLQQLWQENIGQLAYELEEAFLNVFRSKDARFQKPGFFLGAIAMTAGHVLQVSEKMYGYRHDLKPSFDDVLMQTYTHYVNHPADEETSDNNNQAHPTIDWSMLN